MKKQIPILFLLLLMFFIVSVTKKDVLSKNKGPEITNYFTIIDNSGIPQTVSFDNVDNDMNFVDSLRKEYQIINKYSKEIIETVQTKEEALNIMKSNNKSRSSTTLLIEEKLKSISYGVVYLNATSQDGKPYLTFNNISNPGYEGYTTGSYAKDAAYIGTVNGKIRAMQAGVIMDLNPEDINIVDYNVANISHYYVSDGYLYHRYFYGTSSSSSQRVGYAFKNMSEGKKYYSYDGHYFYLNYPDMINNYKSYSTSLSINPSTPYYNYFQFLSHRSKSDFTDIQLDSITNIRVGDSQSKMKGLGKEYIDSQNSFGVNSLLSYGVSANESSYGCSKIAIDKNNLFGHGAVDTNPYYGANGYNSPSDSIKYHAEKFISNGYLDNEDWRYQGGHLGDKSSGINVKYASDPYWGEKAASVYYYNDTYNKDYGKYTIGIISGVQKDFNFYQQPTTSSKIIHTLGYKLSPRTYNLSVIILEKTIDATGETWYKIQSDTALNNDRTDTSWEGLYNFEKDYVYVQGKHIQLISNQTIPTIVKGDVNGNKKVDAADYLMIMDSILGKYTMTDSQKRLGDVNGNMKIDAVDYLMIMDNILGKIKL